MKVNICMLLEGEKIFFRRGVGEIWFLDREIDPKKITKFPHWEEESRSSTGTDV
jgi:hypothetical protein